MPKTADGRIILVALGAFAAWLFVGLPLLYLPPQDHVRGEILGVKYGEWLLFLATMGLWWATLHLAVEGKLASEKTIAEMRRIGEAQVRAYVDISSSEIFFIPLGLLGSYAHPMVRIAAANTGQSPAKNFIWNPTVEYYTASIGDGPRSLTKDLGSNWRDILGVGIAVSQSYVVAAMIPEMELYKFLGNGVEKDVVLIRLRVRFEYEDVFDRRNTGEAFFAGTFKRTDGQKFQTPWGETEWSGKLGRLHKSNDWLKDKEER